MLGISCEPYHAIAHPQVHPTNQNLAPRCCAWLSLQYMHFDTWSTAQEHIFMVLRNDVEEDNAEP